MNLPVTTMGWAEFAELWSASITSVVSRVSTLVFRSSVTVTAEPDQSVDAATASFFAIGLGRSLSGRAALRIDRSSAIMLARLLMTEPVNPDAEFSAAHQDALAELVQMFCGSAAAALKAAQGEEVPVRLLEVPHRSWRTACSASIELSADRSGTHIRACFLADECLADTLQSPRLIRSSADRPLTPFTTVGGDAAGLEGVPGGVEQLSALRSIPLRARVIFGDRTMPLSAVVGWEPGAIVETDRQPEGPVELWVEGILAARGDIVVVDGNYGFCVRELCGTAPRWSAVRGAVVLPGGTHGSPLSEGRAQSELFSLKQPVQESDYLLRA